MRSGQDRTPDFLLLRSWERRNEMFNTSDHSLDTFLFRKKLFFDGHAYELNLNFSADAAGSASGATLEFAEQSVPLGELKIAGKFIRRLMLAGTNYEVICDQPANSIKVPVGDYLSFEAPLEQGGVQAYAALNQSTPMPRISIRTATPATLAIGGPLTNSVTVTRHGQDMQLAYRLLGAGGQTYQVASINRAQPPQFAVLKGGRQIASGNFEFG
jgi:hypothetical protein